MNKDGFLCVHKPSGLTSFDALQIILHGILGGNRPEKRVKIGHAGTLDPLADGVLVVAVNRATKLISYVQQQPKTYLATFRLGVESDSEDTETELRFLDAPPIPENQDVLRILPEFTGEIMQTPPLYSALKLNGKRAYHLARKGREVTLSPRPIFIHSLELISYEYPFLKLKIVCGSGTYIRSLGRDVARRLGSAAVMTALTRTAVGVFRLEDAVPVPATYRKFSRGEGKFPSSGGVPEGRGGQNYPARSPNHPVSGADTSPEEGNFHFVRPPAYAEFLRPLRDAVPEMPTVIFPPEMQRKLKCGIPVEITDAVNQRDFVAIPAENAEMLAIMTRGEDGMFRSVVNFLSPPSF